MSKSYVSLGQLYCVVCGELFDSGELLLDRRLRESLEHKTVTGHGICPKHKDQIDMGMIYAIECNVENGKPVPTGRGIWLTKAFIDNNFTTKIGEHKIIYLQREVCEQIIAAYTAQHGEPSTV